MRRSLVAAALVSACATRSVSTTPPVWERYVSVDRDRLVVATCFDLAHTRCEERAHPLRRRDTDVFALRNSTWLWPASPPLVGTTVRTRFELPAGWSVSTPWPREGDLYTMDATAMRWEGYTLLGPLSREAFTVEGTVFDVTREGFSDVRAPPVERWLGDAWRAVRSLVPSARPPRVQVWLRAAPGSREAVAFGLVSRGGGPSVMFFVDPDATPDLLARDWQATHELVHLVHPVFLDRDAWLREGLATWYQEVLRARSGAQTASSAWSTILDGLTLGATEGSGATLEEESASMGRTHRYHRVYWWGVAVAMTLDVTLRTGVTWRSLARRGDARALRRVSARARARVERERRRLADGAGDGGSPVGARRKPRAVLDGVPRRRGNASRARGPAGIRRGDRLRRRGADGRHPRRDHARTLTRGARARHNPAHGSLAQRQSCGLLIRRSWVRSPDDPLENKGFNRSAPSTESPDWASVCCNRVAAVNPRQRAESRCSTALASWRPYTPGALVVVGDAPIAARTLDPRASLTLPSPSWPRLNRTLTVASGVSGRRRSSLATAPRSTARSRRW